MLLTNTTSTDFAFGDTDKSVKFANRVTVPGNSSVSVNIEPIVPLVLFDRGFQNSVASGSINVGFGPVRSSPDRIYLCAISAFLNRSPNWDICLLPYQSSSSSSSRSSSSSSWSSSSSSTSSLPAESVCGTIVDNTVFPVDWDGLGDGGYNSNVQLRVGDWVTGPVRSRARAFVRFDISSIPPGVTIQSARLYLSYYLSEGDSVPLAAPDSSDVGHVIVDHIEDWGGALVLADYQMASKTANIGTLVSDDTPPGFPVPSWHSIDVTSYIQADLDEADVPDTSCYRLRQSYEEPAASCDSNNTWEFVGCVPNPPYQSLYPYLAVVW